MLIDTSGKGGVMGLSPGIPTITDFSSPSAASDLKIC